MEAAPLIVIASNERNSARSRSLFSNRRFYLRHFTPNRSRYRTKRNFNHSLFTHAPKILVLPITFFIFIFACCEIHKKKKRKRQRTYAPDARNLSESCHISSRLDPSLSHHAYQNATWAWHVPASTGVEARSHSQADGFTAVQTRRRRRRRRVPKHETRTTCRLNLTASSHVHKVPDKSAVKKLPECISTESDKSCSALYFFFLLPHTLLAAS